VKRYPFIWTHTTAERPTEVPELVSRCHQAHGQRDQMRVQIDPHARAARCSAALTSNPVSAAVATSCSLVRISAEAGTDFRDRCLQPLGHPSNSYCAQNLDDPCPARQPAHGRHL
jgi:hypothetical protein